MRGGQVYQVDDIGIKTKSLPGWRKSGDLEVCTDGPYEGTKKWIV